MRFFLTCFRLRLGLQLRDVRIWIILLLLPLLVFALRTALPEDAAAAPVQVGVALPESGGEKFWSLLESRSGTVLTFIPTDTETIDRNVAAGKWDCGLILPADFEERLEKMDTHRIFTLRIGEGSAVYPLVQETVSSCMTTLLRDRIAADYLSGSGMGAVQITELDTDSRVLIHMSTPDGSPISVPSVTAEGIRTFLLWGISAVMLIWILLTGAELGRQFATSLRRLQPLQSATVILTARMGADTLIVCLAGCLCVLSLGVGLCGYLAVLLYCLFLGGVCSLFARVPAIWETIPLWPPFLLVMSLLLSGVLVDPAEAVPALRWIPGRLFLDICRGELVYALPLFAAGIAAICISLLLDRYEKKRCTK